MLPTSLVDRIEVLTTGASVLYGADALGGLVNVSLKDDYEGFDFSLMGNISEKGDNRRFNFSASFGNSFANDTIHYMAFLNIQRYEGLKARDREVSNDPAGFALNGFPTSPHEGGILTKGFGRAPASETGTGIGYALADGKFRNYDRERWISVGDDGLPTGDYLGLPEQRYNWAQHSDLIAPIVTMVFSGNLIYDYKDNHRLFFEHTFARSIVKPEFAPTPVYGEYKQAIFIPMKTPISLMIYGLKYMRRWVKTFRVFF